MNLRNLKYFCMTVEAGGVTAAAERLFVAPTAVSMQISHLEEHLGGALFDRSYRPMKLTFLGNFYYPRAKKLLCEFDDLESETKGLASGKKGWLGVGFVRSTLFNMLPKTIRFFQKELPDVQLNLVETLSDYQVAQLREGLIHLGISRFLGPYEKCKDIQYDVLFHEPFVAVLPNDHALAKKKSICVSDLDGMPFIIYPKDPYSTFSNDLISIIRSAGGDPIVNYEAIEIHTAIALVAAGLGATIVGQCVGDRNTNDVSFIPIKDLKATSSIVVLTKRDHDNEFVKTFINSLHNYIELVKFNRNK